MTPIPSDASWASVAAAAAEAPYRVPVQFDFPRLQRLVNARRAEAEDHIWTLREDPGFFQEAVNDWAEHRQEVLRNKSGKPHPYYDTPEYWARMFRYAVQSAYQKLAMWDTIQKSLDKLEALRQLYPDHGIRITPLPWDYAQELSHFSYLIKKVRPILLSDFHGIVASPPLRDYYLREYYPDPKAILFKRKDNSPVGSSLWYFLWLVEQFAHWEQLELAGIYNFLDEFERVSRNANGIGAPSGNLISPFIALAISELAVVSEVQRQLDWHQPRILPGTVSEQDLEAEYNKRTTLMSIFDRIEAELYDVGMPLMKMKYPAEKRKTAVTVQKMRDAERALDLFWESVDEHYRGKTGKILHDLFSELLTLRQLERTPEWVEPTPPSTPDHLEIVTDQFSTIGFEEPSPGVAVYIPPKTKTKTRGPGTTPKPDEDIQETIQTEESPSFATITVSKRAFRMFSTIFHIDNQELPGEIAWTDFLHGLSSAGFSIEKQHGSAWLFTPSDVAQRSIIFHEPHPTNKIPMHIARRHGRRLTRAYGWTAKTFVSSR